MSAKGIFDGSDDSVEIFNIIWATSCVNEDNSKETQKQIQSLVNSLIKFDNSNQCKKYLEQSSINDRFLIIISGKFGREITQEIEKLRQVSSIYVYCMDKQGNEQWANQHKKIRAVVVTNDELIEAIKQDLPIRLQLDEPFSFNLMTKTNDYSSIYFQLFLQCLLRIKLNSDDHNELITLLKTKSKDNNNKQFDILEEPDKLLHRFTQDSLFNQSLSRSLLNKDFHRIFLFHSLISRLYFQLKQSQPASPMSIYRSQLLSNDEFQNLKMNLNQFISLNSFYFAVNDRNKALETLNTVSSSSDIQRVLFEIDINSTLINMKPFARIGTSEVLVMIAPIFHLKSITTDKSAVSIVKMSLCTDEEYNSILNSIPITFDQTHPHANLRTLAKIFWKMNRLDLAIFYYNRFQNQLSYNDPFLKLIYDDLGMIYLQQKSYQQSLDYFRKSSQIKTQIKDTFIDYFPDIYSSIVHPPCPQIDSCHQSTDIAHMRVYFHHVACRYGGQCRSIENKDHTKQFTHPDYCLKQGECTDMNERHLTDYRHVSLCPKGPNCLLLLKGDDQHRLAYRHCKTNCQFRSYCPHFHNIQHTEEQNHPFKTVCPFTPYMCTFYDQLMANQGDDTTTSVQHCFKYSHVCPFGRYCSNRTKTNHCETNIHILRIECPSGEHCQLINDVNHSNSYSHQTIPDIRQLCQNSKTDCPLYADAKHLKEYRHSGHVHSIGVARYLSLNKHINFVRNQNQMIDSIQKYLQSSNWNPSTMTIPDSILRWIRSLQPVHRCNKLIFESILLHGHVMSRDHMNSLRESRSVAKAIRNHTAIQRIFSKVSNTRLQQTCEEYIYILVDEHFQQVKGTTLTKEQIKRLKEIETIFSTLEITDDNVKTIRKLVTDIAEASLQLHSNQTGIGFGADETLGTNKHVFAILGPHAGYYYGDIIIVFRQELMFHPDSNFSIHAATTFGQSQNAYKWRPWLKDPGTPDKRIEHFHQNKLHCSIPGYELAAAYELIALTGLKDKSTKDIDLNTITTRWINLDPHHVFEAHLPQLIPLDYIEKVYMAETTFKSLSNQAQQSAKIIFCDTLHVTSHQLTGDTPTIKQPIDASRKTYQTFVMEHTLKTIEQRSKAIPSHQGTFVTLPASNFRDFVHLPITISQALTLDPSSDIVYLYWEALKGDMTVVLTYDIIDTDIDQKNLKCLTCHLAKWPRHNTLTTNDYQEGYSYISTCHPYVHYHIIQDGKFQASSNTLHRGCNTDEYIIYNLILNRTTSHVTLAIVGSNSLYNENTLTYTFDKKDLDLTKLEYVQISAGGTVVPIRNFVIQSKPIEEYHPSIDTDCIKANINTTQTSTSTPLKPCSNSIYCQLQYQDTDEGKKHIREYSHPCRFSELCRRKEAHLLHLPHAVPTCSDDDKCTQRGDPLHRAQYRHTDLPDYLIPCRFQDQCRNKSKEDHRIKYFHGEKLPLPS